MNKSYKGFRLGDYVRRKGKIGRIVFIDVTTDPATVTVRMNGSKGHDVGTEFHLIEKVSELELHLENNGKTNQVLNKWKIKIYGNNDIDQSKKDIIKYYNRDKFCFQYLLYKKCDMQNLRKCNCQHKEYINDMIKNGLIQRSLVLLNYLDWYYNKINNPTFNSYLSTINDYVQDIFRNMANETKQFGNWPKSINYYLEVIKGCEDVNMIRSIECHFLFATILKRHGLLQHAVYHFYQALSQSQLNKNCQNNKNISKSNLVYEKNIGYLLELGHCLYLQDCTQNKWLCQQIYNQIINIKCLGNSSKVRNIRNIARMSINQLPIKQKKQTTKQGTAEDVFAFVLHILHENITDIKNYVSESPQYYSIFNLLAMMNVDENQCKNYLQQMGTLDNVTLNHIHNQNLCLQWCLFGTCDDIEFNFLKCGGNHGVSDGESNTIENLIDNKQFDQAWNLCKYFEDSISNKLNKINKDLSILIRIESQLYEYFGDIYNYHNGSRSDRDYKISQYCYCKSINLYCNNNKCIIKLAKLMNNHFKNHFQSISLFDFILNNNYKSKSIDPNVYFEYAMVLRDNGQIDKSIKNFEMALEVNNSSKSNNDYHNADISVSVYVELGFTYYSKGNDFYPTSIKYYNKAIDKCFNKNDPVCTQSRQMIQKMTRGDNNNHQNNSNSESDCKQFEQENGSAGWGQHKKFDANSSGNVFGINNNNLNFQSDCYTNLRAKWQPQRPFRINTQSRTWLRLRASLKKMEARSCFTFDVPLSLPSNWQLLMNQLKSQGYNDETMIKYKIQIYNGNLEKIVKYYEYDEFCHRLAVTGRNFEDTCHCSCKHNLSINNLISSNNATVKSIKQALFLVEYMFYIYDSNIIDDRLKQNYRETYHKTFGKLDFLVAALYHMFGEIIVILAQNRHDFLIGCQSFMKGYEFQPYCGLRHKLHARVLDDGINDWDTAQFFYERAIECQQGSPYTHYSYGLALIARNIVDKAVEVFAKAIQCKENNQKNNPNAGDYGAIVSYYFNYGFVLFRKGPESYPQSIEAYEKGLSLHDAGIGRTGRKFVAAAKRKLEEMKRPRELQLSQDVRTWNVNVKNIHNIDNTIRMNQQFVDNKNNRKPLNNGGRINSKQNGQDRIMTPQDEFDRFWSKLSFGNGIKPRYYQMFVKYKLIDIRKLWNQYDQLPNILLNQIGMNSIHLKYFMRQCMNIKVRHLEFDDWFKYWSEVSNVRKEKYLQVLIDNGIYSFESLRFYIESPRTLEHILENNCTAYEKGDANIILDDLQNFVYSQIGRNAITYN